MAAASLSSLHLHDHLAPSHLNLLFFHALPTFFHFVNFLLVTNLFSLSLLPFLECDSSHNLHALLSLFLFFFIASFLMVLNFLLVRFTLLLHQALLQPILECFVAFLLLNLLLKALSFFLSEQLLFLEGLADQFLLLPFIHAMSSFLVVLVQCSLFHDHFLKEILFGLPDKDFAQAFLMLLDAEPLVVGNLRFSDFKFALAMHLEDTLVNLAHFRLISDVFLKVYLLAIFIYTSISIIDVSLGRFVQPLEQSFIVQVLAILLIHVGFLVDHCIVI